MIRRMIKKIKDNMPKASVGEKTAFSTNDVTKTEHPHFQN
jgi:hypothetical protein